MCDNDTARFHHALCTIRAAGSPAALTRTLCKLILNPRRDLQSYLRCTWCCPITMQILKKNSSFHGERTFFVSHWFFSWVRAAKQDVKGKPVSEAVHSRQARHGRSAMCVCVCAHECFHQLRADLRRRRLPARQVVELLRAEVHSFLVLEHVAPRLSRSTHGRQPVRRWCVNIDRGS